ncbi:MAG: PD-(D/E)XK nuclease family protein [Gammaproteobacteria bacterium]|nr:PD-(D/E)XK nuclease family protein [Gammaproteobacteria bacterium]
MLTLTATEYHAKILAAQALALNPVASIKAIHSWRHFFEAEIQRYFPERLLTRIEEHLLWVQLLKAHPDVPAEQVWSLAKILAENERIRRLHCIPLEEIEAMGRSQHLFFIQLQQQFEQALRDTKSLTFLEGLARLALSHSYEADLFGFVDMPTLYASLLSKGRSAFFQSEKKDLSTTYVFEAAHPIEELQHALHHILNTPNQSFALVVNHATLDSQTLHLILTEMRLSEKIDYVSAIGISLLDQPWFQFFQAWGESFLTSDLTRLSRVLSSVYLGGDPHQNAYWDARLREQAHAQTSLPRFLQSLPPEAQEQTWFKQWQEMSLSMRGKKTITEWLKILNACIFNWPDWTLWQSYLAKVSLLNQNMLHYSWAECLKILTEIAADYYLPAPYYVKPRLHIVGFLEAVDLPVDAVWILSADVLHFPLPASVPAFIPAHLLPPEQPELLLPRIFQGKEILASFIKTDETDLSPLLLNSAARREKGPGEKTLFLQNHSLEWVEDLAQLPLSSEQYQHVRGGSSLLEAQAQCPFKAFARYRLGIREWSEGRTLLDPMQKGTLVHQILERFWQKIRTQRNLLNADLDTVLDPLIEAELPTPLLKLLEKDRLKARLTEWLNIEKQRPDFKVISREESAVLSLAGLLFHLRLDRVDEVAEGGKVVIDYKTGQVNPKDWFKERLEAPQLPMYAVLGHYTAVFYASLKAGKMGFFGEENLGEAQLSRWRDQLEALALEFREGYSGVAPTQTACQYCHLEAVCRIRESQI